MKLYLISDFKKSRDLPVSGRRCLIGRNFLPIQTPKSLPLTADFNPTQYE